MEDKVVAEGVPTPRPWHWKIRAYALAVIVVVVIVSIGYGVYSFVFPLPPRLTGVDCGQSSTGFGGKPNQEAVDCFIGAMQSCSPAHVVVGFSGGYSGGDGTYWVEKTRYGCRFGQYWESWNDYGGHSRSKKYCQSFNVTELSAYERNFLAENSSAVNMSDFRLTDCS